MRKYIVIILILLLSISLNAEKYAGEIFRMGAGVRNFALGNTGLTDTQTNAIAYWNAALLNKISDTRFEVMHAEEYQGLLKYDTAAAVWGNDQKISVVLTRIGINDIPLTKLENEDEEPSYNNRPYKYKSVNNNDIVVYVGLTRRIANLQIGLTPKFAYRSLAEESGFGFGADISTYFDIRDNLLVAVKIRDFFSSQILWSNGTHEIVNPGIDTEASYSMIIPGLKRPGNLRLGLEFITENREEAATIAMGFLSADFHAGLEILLHENIDFMLGYDVDNLTSGFTFRYMNLNINYGFEYDNDLENSHRISLGYRI